MILRLFFACFCGLLLLAVFAPYDPWVKHHVGERFKHAFGQAMNCTIQGDVVAVNIIFPSLTLENVHVKDCDTDLWHWRCKEYSTGFSWLHLLKIKMIDMWVEITDMQMHSAITDKTVHILPHLKRIINPSSVSLPLQFKQFLLQRGSLTLNDASNNYQITLLCSGQAKNINNTIKMRWYISDGQGIVNDHCIWHGVTGSLVCDIYKKQDKSMDVTAQCDISSTIIGSDQERVYFISGGWKESQGTISVHSDDDVISCDPCIITHNQEGWFVKCFGRSMFKELLWIMTGKALDVDGRCFFTINGPLGNDKSVKIRAAVQGCTYKNCSLTAGMKIDAFVKNSQVNGSFLGMVSPYVALSGSWHYDIKNKQGSCTVYNKLRAHCSFTDRWYIKPHDFKINASYDNNNGISLTYDCVFSHSSLEKNHHVQGAIDYQSAQGFLKGFKDEHDNYTASFSFTNYPYLTSFSYHHDGASLLSSLCDEKGIVFDCNLSLIRTILSSCFDREVQAEGNVQVQCSFDAEKITAHCLLDKGIIRLPQTYNFIDGGSVDIAYWWNNKEIQIKKIDGSMHCGTFSMQDGSLFFDAAFKPTFIHIPFVFNRCLFNMKRDLFVMASGHLLLEQRNASPPLLSGSLIIERGQIKENILSQEFQKQIGLFSTKVFTFSSPLIQTDIFVQSRHGIKIDTPFLKTTAKVSLHVTDSVTQPTLTGTITLLGGSLQFPYRPLTINRGFITFSPEKGYDPTIELLARNQVRNHRVALHVTGSLLDHHIALESSPPLTDEQIIGLLLAGSAQESLKNMMPTLIMNNLKSLIFGSNQFNFLNKYFRPLGDTVSINLIPSFTDQSGRGGLRGALEIGVNDRWRALIQKNFSFTEDTRFELEYLFADDITLRAVRDEQKNLGFEAETRWKF